VRRAIVAESVIDSPWCPSTNKYIVSPPTSHVSFFSRSMHALRPAVALHFACEVAMSFQP